MDGGRVVSVVVNSKPGAVRVQTYPHPIPDMKDTDRYVAVTVFDGGRIGVVVHEHGHDPHCIEQALGVTLTREEWDDIAAAVEAVAS
jgi:hypothetical protein